VSGQGDISVVIPYYNRERYIDQAVQSVLAQALKPLEVIIVNDCSRESSRRYLDRYARTCRIVDLEHNVGLAEARNQGIRCAQGRFVAFLDDDDVWLPEKLEVQRRYMDEHPECAAVHTAAWAFFLDSADQLWSRDWPAPITLAQALTNDYCVLIPTTLIRSEVVRAVGGFDSGFRECEDRDFVIRCCAAGYRIESISQPLARIRREGHESLTHNRWRMYRTDLKLCWKHRAFYYQAYGARGFVSFLLEKLGIASYDTRYIDGTVRLLMRLIKVKYKIRPDFREPALRRDWGSAVSAIEG
jgi:teichuronic acid biosynthesis glycosyltransferase TuaG